MKEQYATALENQILKLHRAGLGKKKIAAQLGVTEWKVRSVVRTYITDQSLSYRKQQKNTGHLPLSKVKMAPREKPTKAIILSDIHIPHHDSEALAIAIEYTKNKKADHIVLAGDIMDCYQISSYTKDPGRIETFQDELEQTRSFVKLLRKEFPKAKIDYLSGNHEHRLERQILDKIPQLALVDCIEIPALLKLDELDIKYYDTNQHICLGELEVIHGNMVRSGSGASAKAHHNKTGGSVLHGHVHRLGTYYKTNRWGVHVAIENGHLASLDVDYVDRPDWQQGFTEVDYFEDGRFSFRQHKIDNGCLIVDGQVYTAF